MANYGNLNLLKKEKLVVISNLGPVMLPGLLDRERRVGGIRIPRDVFLQLTTISTF